MLTTTLGGHGPSNSSRVAVQQQLSSRSFGSQQQSVSFPLSPFERESERVIGGSVCVDYFRASDLACVLDYCSWLQIYFRASDLACVLDYCSWLASDVVYL